MSKFILRVRHSKGTTRFDLKDKSETTIKQIKQLISDKLPDHPSITKLQLTKNGKSSDEILSNQMKLSSFDIKHGHMIYMKHISSAIICQSRNNNVNTVNTSTTSSNTNRRNRKRKFNQLENVSNSSTTSNHKRQRLNDNNNEHNHNRNHNHTNSSNTMNSSHTFSTTTNNNADQNGTNSVNQRPPRRRSIGNTSTNTANVKKKLAKKSGKKKKKKKKKDEYLVISTEGDDVDEIVDNYLSDTDGNVLHNALEQLSTSIQHTYTPMARMQAILDDKVEITEFLEKSRFSSRAVSRGKLHLIVNYSFQRRKRKETVCFYDDDKIGDIITNILWTSTDKTKRNDVFLKTKINHKNMLNIINKCNLTYKQMAIRSPPLLWSIFHSFPNQKWEDILVKFVKASIKKLRIRIHSSSTS